MICREPILQRNGSVGKDGPPIRSLRRDPLAPIPPRSQPRGLGERLRVHAGHFFQIRVTADDPPGAGGDIAGRAAPATRRRTGEHGDVDALQTSRGISDVVRTIERHRLSDRKGVWCSRPCPDDARAGDSRAACQRSRAWLRRCPIHGWSSCPNMIRCPSTVRTPNSRMPQGLSDSVCVNSAPAARYSSNSAAASDTVT